MSFLELEGAYLVIGIFILGVTAFVSTRDFMPSNSFKKGFFSVFAVLAFMIGSHYFVTMARMNDVKAAFQNGENIICESKEIRKVAQSITINKNGGWIMEGDDFSSKEYSRVFHSARCITAD